MHWRIVCILAAAWIWAAAVPAPPAIDPGGVWNAAGRMPPSLPGGALARGGRFTISGVRLGPERGVAGSESDPPSELADVTVRFGAVRAGLFYVSAERIEGWIPPAVPAGSSRLVVTYQGRASEPHELNVEETSFGFFASDPQPAVTPGGTVTLSGSGLGPAELEVWVGERRASPVRREAEACCKGVERISFQAPPDAPLGCAVPVVARAAGRASNVVAIAVHGPGQACRDQVDWLRESVDHAARAGFVAVVHASVAIFGGRDSQAVENNFEFDYGVAGFGKQESGQRQFPPLPPERTCTRIADRINLRQWRSEVRAPGGWAAIPQPQRGNRRLDAGPTLAVGSRQLQPRERGTESYDGVLGGRVPFSRAPVLPLLPTRGRIAVSGRGGADVGPFAIALPVAAPIVWKNRARIAEVDRAAGVTVEWKAARAADAVVILAGSSDDISGDSALCLCVAPARDGRFTIPPLWLSSLPPNAKRDSLNAGVLALVEIPFQAPVRIPARGLDAAYAAHLSLSGRPVAYR